MDLDPETVKQEIEAVKFACDQVDARLRGRANPTRSGGILSRVSKVSGQLAEPSGQRAGPAAHQHGSRHNSRRFVNRDWNVARKRTAEGLFDDDQTEQIAVEHPMSEQQSKPQQNGFHPRKRVHRDEQNYPSQQEYPSDHTNSIRSRVTFTSRDGQSGRHPDEQNARLRTGEQQYDPFEAPITDHPDSHHQQEYKNHEHPQRDGYHPREYDRGPAAQPLRPYNRDGQPSRNGRNEHMHDRLTSFPSRRDGDRGIATNSKSRRQESGGRFEAGAVPDGEAQPKPENAEDGELPDDLPGPPEGSEWPATQFVAEKRPEPKRAATAADRGRNRRMLGALMGHLHKAEKQERSFELSEVVQRRKELERHAEQRAREENLKAKLAARQRAREERRKDVQQKRELLLQHNMKQAKLLCAQKIHHARDLLKFIRTQTVPPILWKPFRENEDVLKIYDQQAQDFELWADKQAAKLQAEQHNMRQRAEKQWSDLDNMHEIHLQQRRAGPSRGGDRDFDGHRGQGGAFNRHERPERPDMARRDAGGPLQLSTAQQAMLDRERKKGNSSSGAGEAGDAPPRGLTTAQQAMLDRERKMRSSAGNAEGDGDGDAGDHMHASGGDGEVALVDVEAVEGDADEALREAEADEAEALDEGYLLDDAALADEMNATDNNEDEAQHDTERLDDAAEEQAERFEALAQEDEPNNESVPGTDGEEVPE